MAVTLFREVALQAGIEVSPEEGPRMIIMEVHDRNLLEVEKALLLRAIISEPAGLLGLVVVIPFKATKPLLEVTNSEVIPSEGLEASLAKERDVLIKGLSTWMARALKILKDLLPVKSRVIRGSTDLGFVPAFDGEGRGLTELTDGSKGKGSMRPSRREHCGSYRGSRCGAPVVRSG
ncbi:hypothetical protein ACLOJK_022694, partial [Asimina triloba]